MSIGGTLPDGSAPATWVHAPPELLEFEPEACPSGGVNVNRLGSCWCSTRTEGGSVNDPFPRAYTPICAVPPIPD
jgi:hypothetical protein